MTYKSKIAIAITIFLWASAFVGIRAGLQDYSPGGLALLRYLVASLCMGIVYFRIPARNNITLVDKLALLAIGAIGIGIYNITLNYGELSISSGMSSFIISQSPLVTAILALIFLGERIKTVGVIGFIISIFGVVLITLGETKNFSWNISMLYLLLSTLAGSCYALLQKPLLKKYHAIEATTYVIWGGTLFLLMYAPHLCQEIMSASLKSTLTVVYLGIFPAAIGYLAWTYVLAEIPTSRAVSFMYFLPFVATLLGWLCLGEVPMMLSVVGGLLAIAGVVLVNRSYRSANRVVIEA